MVIIAFAWIQTSDRLQLRVPINSDGGLASLAHVYRGWGWGQAKGKPTARLMTIILCRVRNPFRKLTLPLVNGFAFKRASTVKPSSTEQLCELDRTFEVELRRGIGFHEQRAGQCPVPFFLDEILDAFQQ